MVRLTYSFQIELEAWNIIDYINMNESCEEKKYETQDIQQFRLTADPTIIKVLMSDGKAYEFNTTLELQDEMKNIPQPSMTTTIFK